MVEGNYQSPELLLTSDECHTQVQKINVFFKSWVFFFEFQRKKHILSCIKVYHRNVHMLLWLPGSYLGESDNWFFGKWEGKL